MEKQIPQFLKDLLIEQYGEEISTKIENGYKAQRPVTLRVNNLKLNGLLQMSTSIQADYTLVSWLEEAENALTNDLYLVSQYDTDTDEWISKKLSYDKLCALVLNGIDNRVSATCSAYLEDLSVKIDTLSISLSSTSCLLDDTVSAVIKMANCI